jgi:Fe-S oxidoreductase
MHSLDHLVTLIFWLAVAALAFGTARRARLWRAGAAAPLDWAQLLRVPRRYLVDVHHVVARDPYIARTHMLVAGGAVAALALVALNYGLMLYWPLLNGAIVLAAAVMLGGSYLVWQRRRAPLARLSGGHWNRLPYTLAAFAAGLLALALLPSALLSGFFAALIMLALLAGTAELVLGIGTGGPMKHAVAGVLHLAFHPRAERFATRSTALRPLDLAAPVLGVEKPTDFRWNQLLGFDACVQCGKCEAACPAFAAGQPLNPKKFIQDMVLGLSGGSDAQFAGSPYPGIALGGHAGAPEQPILPALLAPETLWSCTTCRACVEECPMQIEHVDAIIDLRRFQTLERGAVPGKGPEMLANLRETATQGGYDNAARYHWAVDLNVRQIRPGEPVDVLLVAGEGAFDMRYQRSLRALVKLLQAASVDFAILGALEVDTGDTARRLGDEATFQAQAARLIATLSPLNFGRILTADPHVFHSLKNEYPALGGHYTVLHHTIFLAGLAGSGQLKLGTTRETRAITYHDPCYLGRYNGETEAPRALLRQIGVRLTEMERSGLRGRCCGGGGGAPLTDIPGAQRIPDIRIADARATGAGLVAVACPGCTAMLEGVVGPRPEVIDVAELLAAALESQA